MIVTDNGIPLSAVPEGPDPEHGPLVIVLHGFTGNKDRPHTLAACGAMHDAGFATLRADLYGHGESGGEFRDHTVSKWLSNTLALIAWARRADPAREIWLSGHSQGGLTAALAAGMPENRIRGLILRAPAFMIPEGAREGCLMGRSFDPKEVPEEIRIAGELTLDGGYIRDAQGIDALGAADRFGGSVLILQGGRDDVVPPEVSARAARHYKKCDLRIIPGEGHHFDTFPFVMRDLIREWLEKQKTDTEIKGGK